MMTTTDLIPEPPTLIPQVVDEEHDEGGGLLFLPVPPISVERALKSEFNKAEEDQDENSCDSSDSSKNDDAIIRDHDSYIRARSIVVTTHESHYTNLDHLRTLEEGGCLFSFVCNHEMTPYETEMFNSVANLTAFDDETKENYVPHYEYHRRNDDDDETTTDNNNSASNNENGEYTFLLARCAYLLVGADVNQLLANPSLLSSLEYQSACQPSGTIVWDDYDKMQPDNFRITKPIIPYLYNFTIQFRVSGNLSPEALSRLGRHVGTRVDGGILLERTKRSVPPKEDATKKVKSVLLYTDLGKSVFLVTHLTLLLQQGLPEIVERAIDTFGQWGLGESCETAWRTRKYLKKVMPAAVQDGVETLPMLSQTSESSSNKKQGELIEDATDSDEEDDERFYDVDQITDPETDDGY